MQKAQPNKTKVYGALMSKNVNPVNQEEDQKNLIMDVLVVETKVVAAEDNYLVGTVAPISLKEN